MVCSHIYLLIFTLPLLISFSVGKCPLITVVQLLKTKRGMTGGGRGAATPRQFISANVLLLVSNEAVYQSSALRLCLRGDRFH